MTEPTKRPYNSQNRQAQAAQTKARILEQAQMLFRTEGFDKVTIEKIAQSSQVSTPTIYALYQSKLGVLRAIFDEGVAKDKYEALLAEGRSKNTPWDWIRIAAELSRILYDAEVDQMEMLQGASVLSPEFKLLEKEREERRYKRQEESIKEMWEQGWVKKGLTFQEVRDISWAFTGRDMYRLLVLERGWSADQYEKWLRETLTVLLADSEKMAQRNLKPS